jgi:hypothetical protein
MGKAGSKHIEIYLKAIWYISERKGDKGQIHCQTAQCDTSICCTDAS